MFTVNFTGTQFIKLCTVFMCCVYNFTGVAIMAEHDGYSLKDGKRCSNSTGHKTNL